MDEEFIRRRTADVILLDGTRVIVQPIVPEAKEMLVTGFERLSPRSRYRRFFSPIRELSEEQLRRLTEIDYVDHFAWTARTSGEPGEPGVGVSRYVRLAEDPQAAEAAVTVIDAYQDRGLGTFLFEALAAVAVTNGIRTFVGHVLEENRPARALLEQAGGKTRFEAPGMLQVDVDLDHLMEALDGSPLLAVLRDLAAGEAPGAIDLGELSSPH